MRPAFSSLAKRGDLRNKNCKESATTSVLSPKYEVFCCDQNGPPARRKEGASRTSLTSRRTNQGRYKRQTGAGRDRRATQPPAHFHRNPLGRGQLAVFPPPRRIDPYDSEMGASLAP